MKHGGGAQKGKRCEPSGSETLENMGRNGMERHLDLKASNTGYPARYLSLKWLAKVKESIFLYSEALLSQSSISIE
jgi:hypothetical protein